MLNQSGTIARRSLHDELVERICDLIVEGTLLPGEKIPEQELSKQFGVSRTPLREALKVLAAEGLVALSMNRGAWVTPVSQDELEELFPVMAALEVLSGKLACERITDAELEVIASLHNDMVKAFEKRELTDYFTANQNIHEAILKAAHNRTLEQQHHQLSARMRRARYLADMTEDRWTKSMTEHNEILRALMDRDGDKLGHVLETHLANKFVTVRDWLNRV